MEEATLVFLNNVEPRLVIGSWRWCWKLQGVQFGHFGLVLSCLACQPRDRPLFFTVYARMDLDVPLHRHSIVLLRLRGHDVHGLNEDARMQACLSSIRLYTL